jgi:hypothetical protein
LASGQPEVAVFDGDSVVRKAVEVLLQAAGYRVRSLREPTVGDIDELLVNSRLLLVAPDLSARRRRILVGFLSSLPLSAELAILELVPEGAESGLYGARSVPWPCSMEQLRREIDAALRAED